jgi:uncharacterized protein with von Willebrand factor type A (vWA) domain
VIDSRAVTRVVDELVWMLRRAGIRVATSQAIDCARALALVGFENKAQVREALACIVVHDARDRARFDTAFDAFFAPAREARTLWERLGARGFTAEELDVLRALLEDLSRAGADGARLGVLVTRGAELDRLLYLAGVSRSLDRMQSELQAGFYTHKVLGELGLPKSYHALFALRAALRDALGERGEGLADAVRDELDRTSEEVRGHVRSTFARRKSELENARASLATKELALLDEAESAAVRRAVRAFVERLRGGQRVRVRHARRGRIDPHRTLRRAWRTGGVPFVPVRRKKRRDKARLVLLCDVSDSVRAVARFTLELTYAAQELFLRARSFVFVSELGETTELFLREPLPSALAAAYGGAVVSIADNSNYGRVLRAFEARHLAEVNRRTTVVILGDGRTNYQTDAADVLDAIRARARALLWLCPEPRAEWALGDSAMARYAPRCTRVLEVRCAKDLEEAARAILAAR